MDVLAAVLVWLACHFVGDFAFQSGWMSANKGKSWEINAYHAATYTAVFVLFARATPAAIAIIFLTHCIIDPLKTRYNIIKPIWVDQALHFMVIFALLALQFAFPDSIFGLHAALPGLIIGK
ncbi:MAG TPA: DUF3307 domain-containing protein [Ktedonobacterales bacterium]|jgi:hypothetical protein